MLANIGGASPGVLNDAGFIGLVRVLQPPPLLQTLSCSPLSVLPPILYPPPRAMPQLLPTSHSWLLLTLMAAAHAFLLFSPAGRGRRALPDRLHARRREGALQVQPAGGVRAPLSPHRQNVFIALTPCPPLQTGSACNPIGRGPDSGGPDLLLPRAKCTLPCCSDPAKSDGPAVTVCIVSHLHRTPAPSSGQCR